MKLSSKAFDKAVQKAYGRIPKEIRERMGNVVLTVQSRPTEEMLISMGYPTDEPLLGLYEGGSLLEHSFFEPPGMPDRIFIFQDPLEEMCDSVEELEWEIEVTVVHEIAHFLGISEARLEELGYG